MNTIYVGQYTCLRTDESGITPYMDVALGLPGKDVACVVVRMTCSRFQVGKEYLVTITETGG